MADIEVVSDKGVYVERIIVKRILGVVGVWFEGQLAKGKPKLILSEDEAAELHNELGRWMANG